MNIFTLDVKLNEPCTLALGYFDGVHLGHQMVIELAVKKAKEKGVKCGVFTFTDKERLCRKKAERGEIYTRERCLEYLEDLGVDFVIMPDFKEFCSLAPNEFVNLICGRYGARALFCGEDYKFGKQALGNTDMLSKLAKKEGAEVFVCKKVSENGVLVSSTAICAALKEGNIELANALLGRPFSIKSEVVGGKHIGKKHLYPTVNQHFDKDSVPVKNAVYASRASFNGKTYPAVTNIGFCPTVQSKKEEPVAETYIIDENAELYGSIIEVELLRHLRDEKKFDSIEALKEQISVDIEAARRQ